MWHKQAIIYNAVIPVHIVGPLAATIVNNWCWYRYFCINPTTYKRCFSAYL